MDIFIVISVAVVAIILFVVLSNLAGFENSKSIEYRRLEAERERKWLDHHHIGWYDRHGR